MFFQQDKHYNLRSDFPVPRYNTVNYGKNSIRYLGPQIWGKISQELRSKTNLHAFRRGPGCVLSMCWACWTARVAAVHAHLRVVGRHSGFCCVADWCIGRVLPYPLFNSSNLNFLDF